MPVSHTYQYLLFWYAAETLPQDLEDMLNATETPTRPSTAEHSRGTIDTDATSTVVKKFAIAPPFPDTLTLKQRAGMDERVGTDGVKCVYEPRRHEGTGVDEEELLYEGHLLPVQDAIETLGGTSGDVVRRAWEAVCLRRRMEEEAQ